MVRRSVVARVTKPSRPAIAASPTAGAPGRQPGPVAADVPRPEPASERPDATLPRADRAPVIQSKIQPPPLPSSTLSRPRLLERLMDAASSRVTLVVAEAGYGKTTLLADFSARASVRVLWYRLDPTDRDPITWTNYLIAAVREIDPTFGSATLALLSQVSSAGPSDVPVVRSFLSELPGIGATPTVLVLDDYQAIDESGVIQELVTQLLTDSPSWMHFVISSRQKPSIGLARLASSGQLTELGTDDLRFTESETESLFSDAYGLTLDADIVAELDERTRGWAASLQLFYGSVRGRPPGVIRSVARSLSGASGPIYDFLAQEVLRNLSPELEEFLVRVSLLDRIVARRAGALYSDRRGLGPDDSQVESWIEECDRLGLVARSSNTSDTRELHPLLRDFLLRRLRRAYSADAVRRMHAAIAQAMAGTEPLIAARHFIEAGDHTSAMMCLGRSVMLTMGSGQSGLASELIDRLEGIPANPAVAAIRARHRIEVGDLEGAAGVLSSVDVTDAAPDVRAVIRHLKLSLGWRVPDRDLMYATLVEIEGDPETPAEFREIFRIYRDTDPAATVPFSALADRMVRMAEGQAARGHSYFAAISLHNAAITMLTVGRPAEAKRLAAAALDAFNRVPGLDTEKFSTHAVLARIAFELGDQRSGEEHLRIALSSGAAHGDVHAECAYTLAMIGDQTRAHQLLLTAYELEREGKSDVTGLLNSASARALINLTTRPDEVIGDLAAIPSAMPLDTGYDLDRHFLLALAHLGAGRPADAGAIAASGRSIARKKVARAADARLGLVLAMAEGNSEQLRDAISDAVRTGEMALLATVDILARHLFLIPEGPPEVRRSIQSWPRRWLPALRRQLDGKSANAFAAAALLDDYGELQDVGRLRAYAKTYRRGGRESWALGKRLARKLSPTLEVNDLGRTSLVIGPREVRLSEMRRKPAALLMFLVTRPGLTATREQTIDLLWPDSDPGSAANNLNQSLYFLRREIDPWYEDDVSADYVGFEGDVVWLDTSLVRVGSVQFAFDARRLMGGKASSGEILNLVDQYLGQFCPEFEYEEWAMAWRARVHAIYLQFASWAIKELTARNELEAAQSAASSALDRDPAAYDIERKLIWLYWRLGSRSAARAQFDHLAAQEVSDALEASSFQGIVQSEGPPEE